MHQARTAALFMTLAIVGCSSSGKNGASTSAGDGGSDGSASADGSSGGPRDSAAGNDGAGARDGAGTGDGGWTFAPTTSVAELTQNDTSGCGTAAPPCKSPWTQTQSVTYGTGSSYAGQTRTVTGFWDHAVATGAQDAGSARGYVSKIPVSALLPGQSTPVWVETQNWWGTSSHIDNGEDSSNAAQVKNQVADHISRGFAGQVVDWDGQGKTADKALPTIQSGAEASGGKYQFAVMIDKALFDYTCGANVACLNGAIAYLVATYTGSPAYLKDSGGHPILFFFVNQYYASDYPILQSSSVDAKGTSFVMYEPNGFPGNDPPNTIGEYAWVNPGDGATMTQTTGSAGTFSWSSDFGFEDLTGFFGAASSNPSSFAVSEAHKGFDDNLANWSLNRIIDQQCGMAWLESFDHTGSFGGSASYEATYNYVASGRHLDFVMVDTWDDYEEGTEIETGIDNCLSKVDVTVAGSTLSWTPTWGADPMNAAVTGSEATLYEYSVYMARQGSSELMDVADLACKSGSCPHSLDLSALGVTGGPYVFYVDAIGMPSIVNTLAGPTSTAFTR
jgi:hypothetical protein